MIDFEGKGSRWVRNDEIHKGTLEQVEAIKASPTKDYVSCSQCNKDFPPTKLIHGKCKPCYDEVKSKQEKAKEEVKSISSCSQCGERAPSFALIDGLCFNCMEKEKKKLERQT